VIILWINQFLIFGPLLSFHAQLVCQNESDPFTPCLPEPNQKTKESESAAQTENKNDILYHENQFENPQPGIATNNNNQNIDINNFQTANSTEIDQTPVNLLNRVFNFY